MPYPMDDPRYYYKPRTEAQRRASSLRARRRLGIPDGLAQLYGLHVPIAYAESIKTDAIWIAHTAGWAKAQEFIQRVKDIDWSLVEELYEEHTPYRDLAQYCGVPGWYVEKRTRHLRRINPRYYTEPRRDSE